MCSRPLLVLGVLAGGLIGPLAAFDEPSRSAAQTVDLASDWGARSFWRTLEGETPGDSWEFVDGEVRLVEPRGGQGSLLSPPLPAHFELSWKWMIEPHANTGVKYRVRKFGGRWLGIEYQIIDEPIPLAAVHKGSTASIYDLIAPRLDKPLQPAGAWNEGRVVAVGDKLEHYLNGVLVASTAITGPEWESPLVRSKFYGEHRFGQPTAGDRIMLTDHDGRVTYRDFRFVAHDPPLQRPRSDDSPPQLGNALRNGWADQNSVVIWTRTTARREMVDNGPQANSRDSRRVADLSSSPDQELRLTSQLPAGASPAEMLGACPGAPGEVRLSYFPLGRHDDEKSTPWVRTSEADDFTALWRLGDLEPGTSYAAIVEARPLGAAAVSAVVRGSFRTAPAVDAAAGVTFCMQQLELTLRHHWVDGQEVGKFVFFAD